RDTAGRWRSQDRHGGGRSLGRSGADLRAAVQRREAGRDADRRPAHHSLRSGSRAGRQGRAAPLIPLSRLLSVLVLLPGISAGLVRQQPAVATDTPAPKPQPLFDSTTPLRVTFAADFGALSKDRGTKKDTLPGTLTVVGAAGDSVTLKVQVYTRGHYRLKICQY